MVSSIARPRFGDGVTGGGATPQTSLRSGLGVGVHFKKCLEPARCGIADRLAVLGLPK